MLLVTQRYHITTTATHLEFFALEHGGRPSVQLVEDFDESLVLFVGVDLRVDVTEDFFGKVVSMTQQLTISLSLCNIHVIAVILEGALHCIDIDIYRYIQGN